MSATAILPERLKTVRKARKIGRTKLAKMSGMTECALTKLETGKENSLAAASLEQLADALQITPFVLTGELALSDSDMKPASTCKSGCCG